MRTKQIEICEFEHNLHNRIYHLKALGKDCEMVRIVTNFFLYKIKKEYGFRYYVIEIGCNWSYEVEDITLEEIKSGIKFINRCKTMDLCEYVDDLWKLDPVPTKSGKSRLCV